MIYLDNAATSFPKPRSVINAMCRSQALFGANPGRGGHKMTMHAGEIVYSCRKAMADFFSSDEERVVFTNNCTYALNTAIKGSVKKGDHVIISSLEHNSVLRPVHKLKERGIITYDVFEVNPLSDDETFMNFLKTVQSDTSLVVMSAVSNVFGTVLPFERIGRYCRMKKIRFVLDGAQAAGSHRISMKNMPIDILCFPGHKGLLGPMGTGGLVLADGIEADSLVEGGTGGNSMSEHQPDFYPDRLESGTLNLPGIAGLNEGIKFIGSLGGERAVLEKESYLINMLKEDISVIPKITVYDEMHSTKMTNVLSFNFDDMQSEETASLLDKRGIAVRAGFHCSYLAHSTYGTAQTGTVRVSTGVFSTKKQLKNLSFCLNKIALGAKM